ncbi:hypothetical protein [Microvirga pudoricolor]|uniref:hypothetical protein n=1 Tax=Microvirga pudoricolor TaxID=2778729 RepID=UPI0019509DA6|nr:hypothetical protein [Microvirga pudoricolor]MBM6595055.1 hypothetical protein [Microvirga pudoricolor]
MHKAARAKLCDELKQEALTSTRGTVTLSVVVEDLERQGEVGMAKAAQNIAVHNEIERIKLQAKIDANDS